MFTQCQHCLTMFRITPEQLKAAEGKVRCCQCNNVFNALHSLMESPETFTNQSDIRKEPLATTQNEMITEAGSPSMSEDVSPDELAISSDLSSDSEIEKSLDALADDHPPMQQPHEESILEVDDHSSNYDSQSHFLLEQDDGLETEPEYFAAGTESQMSELLDRDSASLLLSDTSDEDNVAEIISFGSHDNMFPDTDQSIETEEESDLQRESEPAAEIISAQLDANPTDEAYSQSQTPSQEGVPFTFEEEYETQQPNRYRYYWIIGSILLLFPLSGQVAWYSRDNLVTHEVGRHLLQSLCGIVGCEVPVRRDIEQIIISDRALTAHPEKKDVLTLRLEMMNAAAFQQPFPKLQLSLYNDMGKIIARRTFLPGEYMAEAYQPQQMMPIQKPIHVELELLDPGNEVTGFKFDFL